LNKLYTDLIDTFNAYAYVIDTAYMSSNLNANNRDRLKLYTCGGIELYHKYKCIVCVTAITIF
jgi:hypothetical protein